MMRWLWYWLGVWKIQPWPTCYEYKCDRKAKWMTIIDKGGWDHSEFFFCDAHIDDHETGGAVTSLMKAET